MSSLSTGERGASVIWRSAVRANFSTQGACDGPRHAHMDRSIGQRPGCSRRISKPVDPRTQMGALLWQARDRALLFENLPGYPGWRCLGQAPGDVSLAPVAFGTPREEMIPEFVRRTEKLGTTRLVETGPVQQKVLIGDEVDITQMPIHQAGIRDGGPFIGSGLMITKNPQTGQRNLSFHRLQMKGPKKTGHTAYIRATPGPTTKCTKRRISRCPWRS